MWTPVTTRVDRVAARRLLYVNLVAAVAFVFGGSLFALGAVFAQLGVGSLSTVNVTYLVGGFFFSLGGYVSILLAGNRRRRRADAVVGLPAATAAGTAPSCCSSGTLFFAVSLVAAFAEGLTPRQSNGWIWLPDITGCVCFLASRATWRMLDVGDGHVRVPASRPRLVGGRGQPARLGPVLPRRPRRLHPPGHLQAINVGLVNWGTFAGALCFAVGGVIQAFDTPTPTRTVVSSSHDTSSATQRPKRSSATGS